MEIQLFNTQTSKPSVFQSGYIEGAKLIGADKFGEQGRYGEGLKVAIIDTGCDISHPDLKDRIIDVRNFTDDDKGAINNVTDYTQDFFGKETNLTVSGQLNCETFAQAFRNVYTFGPTFRAENSNTIPGA